MNGDGVLICYDGSDDAKRAIRDAGRLLGGRHAVVLTVWQPTAALGSLALAGVSESTLDFVEVDRAAAERGTRLAAEGARLAEASGLDAEAMPVKASGPIWKTILEVAKDHDAAAIAMGSRGLRGVRSILLGSVSSAVSRHADRPTLIVPHPRGEAECLAEAGDEQPLAWPAGA